MTDFPRSLIEFQQRFGDEAACAQYLVAARWPDGFVCPRCGGGKAWRLETKARTYECASLRSPDLGETEGIMGFGAVFVAGKARQRASPEIRKCSVRTFFTT